MIVEILSKFGVTYENDFKEINDLYEQIWGLESLTVFSEQFKSYFSYGKNKYNIKNEKMQTLIIYHWRLKRLLEEKKCDNIIIFNKKDELLDLPFFDRSNIDENKEFKFSEINNKLKAFYLWLKSDLI